MQYCAEVDGEKFIIHLEKQDKSIKARIKEKTLEIDLEKIENTSLYSILINGKSLLFSIENNKTELKITLRNESYPVKIVPVLRGQKEERGKEEGLMVCKTPMAGMLATLLVRPGKMVNVGDGLFILEAMKMRNEIKARAKGVVKEILARVGSSVETGQAILTLEITS